MNINDLFDTDKRIELRRHERILEQQILDGLLPLEDHPYYNFEGQKLVSVNLRSNSYFKIPLGIFRGALKSMRILCDLDTDIPHIYQTGMDYIKNTEWFKSLPQSMKDKLNLKSFTELIDKDYWFENNKLR